MNETLSYILLGIEIIATIGIVQAFCALGVTKRHIKETQEEIDKLDFIIKELDGIMEREA